jgi:hypothetical protein
MKLPKFSKPSQSLVADIVEYAGMAILAVSIGFFDWRVGGIVLALELLFIAYALGKNNDTN